MKFGHLGPHLEKWPPTASENPKMASGGQTKARIKKVHKTKVAQNSILPLKTPLKSKKSAKKISNFMRGSPPKKYQCGLVIVVRNQIRGDSDLKRSFIDRD